jgi:hypothetical protein
MRVTSLSLQVLLGVLFISTAAGCGSKKAASPSGGKTSAAVPHHHDHGTASGPHGGSVVGLDTEKYHAEVTHDASSNRVGVYILGDDATTSVPLEAKSVTIDVKEYGKPAQYVLPAVAQAEDGAGKSSYFEIVSEPLTAVIIGQSEDPNAEARVSITADGKPQVGYIDTHHAAEATAHGHTHAEDDALVWLQKQNEQGYDIAVGHHGVTLLAGRKVEPAVQITREGKPVADAKVFNALLAEDGKTVLSEEVPTVYEPPTGEEPSHYAQGPLEIPGGTRSVVLRYRIVLPDGKGERTVDVPASVK